MPTLQVACGLLAGVRTADSLQEALARIFCGSGHEAVARTAREVFAIAEAANDQPTADLLTQRLQIHEKTAWMLRALQ